MVGLAEVRNHFLSILQTLAITRCVFVACGHVGLDTLGRIARRVFETSPFGRTRTERRRHTRVGSFEVEKTSLDVSDGSVHVSEGRVYGLHSSSCFRRTLDFSLGKNIVLCIFTEKREGWKTFQLIIRKILDVDQSRTNGLGHLVFRRRTVRSRRREWSSQNENHFHEKHNQGQDMSDEMLLIHCKTKGGKDANYQQKIEGSEKMKAVSEENLENHFHLILSHKPFSPKSNYLEKTNFNCTLNKHCT